MLNKFLFFNSFHHASLLIYHWTVSPVIKLYCETSRATAVILLNQARSVNLRRSLVCSTNLFQPQYFSDKNFQMLFVPLIVSMPDFSLVQTTSIAYKIIYINPWPHMHSVSMSGTYLFRLNLEYQRINWYWYGPKFLTLDNCWQTVTADMWFNDYIRACLWGEYDLKV